MFVVHVSVSQLANAKGKVGVASSISHHICSTGCSSNVFISIVPQSPTIWSKVLLVSHFLYTVVSNAIPYFSGQPGTMWPYLRYTFMCLGTDLQNTRHWYSCTVMVLAKPYEEWAHVLALSPGYYSFFHHNFRLTTRRPGWFLFCSVIVTWTSGGHNCPLTSVRVHV